MAEDLRPVKCPIHAANRLKLLAALEGRRMPDILAELINKAWEEAGYNQPIQINPEKIIENAYWANANKEYEAQAALIEADDE